MRYGVFKREHDMHPTFRAVQPSRTHVPRCAPCPSPADPCSAERAVEQAPGCTMRRSLLKLAVAGSTGVAGLPGFAAAGGAAVPDSPSLRQSASTRRDTARWREGPLDLAYLDTGESHLPALVCLHAIGHGSGDFDALADALQGRHRLIAPDWPGQGRSGTVPWTPGVRAYAAALQSFVDALRLPRFALVGNSVGGGAALLYAAANPRHVRAVVVANPAGLDEGGWLGRLFTRWMSSRFAAAERDPGAFLEWFARYYEGVLSGPAALAQRERIVASGLEIAPLLAQAWQGFADPRNDIRDELPTLSLPVLVTWARRDRLVRWSRNRRAVERIPRVQVEFFEAGHTPFLEDPARFAASLEAFLATAP